MLGSRCRRICTVFPHGSPVLPFSSISSFSTATAVHQSSDIPATLNDSATPDKSIKRRHTLIKFVEGQQKDIVNIFEGLRLVKESAWANFDETVEIAINTGLDPRKPNQSVKGVARLPNGTGKAVRVCVIANATDAELAKAAGADIVGADDVIALIQGGDVNFNTVIATPDMMPVISKIGRV